MRIDTTMVEKDLLVSGDRAAQAEGWGLDAVWCTETGLDVFLQAYESVRRTGTVRVGTAIAVALARNPMTVAYSAWNLADVSAGRFTLGLGSQVKAHIERRYSMPWERPVAQMREFVLALREIWSSWRTGERLEFVGEHYQHTLMSPFWTPRHHDHDIPIHLAAVGPRMVEMAAEVADGIILHAFNNRPYLDEVILPAVERGLKRAGRALGDLEISVPMFMAMGDTDAEVEASHAKVAAQLGFYASTPSYRPVMDAIGFGDLQPRLTALSKAGAWDQLADTMPAEFIDQFVISGRPEEMPALARERWGGSIQRTSSYYGWAVDDPARLGSIFESFRQE